MIAAMAASISPALDPRIARLADTDVLDLEGRRFRLGELWREQAALLVFVRHFG